MPDVSLSKPDPHAYPGTGLKPVSYSSKLTSAKGRESPRRDAGQKIGLWRRGPRPVLRELLGSAASG